MIDLSTLAKNVISGDADISDEDLHNILEIASDVYFNLSEDNETDIVDVNVNGDKISIAYSLAETVMSDELFNALSKLYKTRCPNNIFAEQTGSNVRSGKEKLPFVMGGLTELYENETEQWIFKNNLLNEQHVVEDKLDGISAGLIYENGIFIDGYSRGNGVMGANITRHLKKLSSVPKRIKTKERLELRAEIIMPIGLWPAHQEAVETKTGRKYKNPRNYVAGKFNSKEAPDDFYNVVDLVITGVNNRDEYSVLKNLEFVRNNGFKVVEYVIVNGKDINDNLLHELLFNRRKESIYEIDGIVVTVDDPEKRKKILKTTSSLNPVHSVKIKFGSAENNATTTVVDVHYELSKDGYAKPRVEFTPVELGGVTITFATGFNAGYIKNNNIGPGTVIQITRSGDVIPYIESVIQETEALLPDDYEDLYDWSEGEVDLILKDASSNIEVIKKKVLSFFTSLDVSKLKEASVSKIVEAGYTEIDTIIRMSKSELMELIGKSAGESVYNSIKEKLNPVSPPVLAGSSGMLGRGIGKRKIQKIFDKYGKIDVTFEELLEVESFEQKTAQTYISNFIKYQNFLEKINGYYTLFDPNTQKTSNNLEGVVAVLTGFRDKELEEIITNNGGKIGSSVGKNTTVVVCASVNENSSKIKKADELGIEKITIDEAYERFNFDK